MYPGHNKQQTVPDMLKRKRVLEMNGRRKFARNTPSGINANLKIGVS